LGWARERGLDISEGDFGVVHVGGETDGVFARPKGFGVSEGGSLDGIEHPQSSPTATTLFALDRVEMKN